METWHPPGGGWHSNAFLVKHPGEGRALYTEKMRPGEVFVPLVNLQDHAANFVTNSALDPNSKIPEYKVCAVRNEKI